MRLPAWICYRALMKGFTESDFYRRLHTGNPGDVDFYVRAARGASTVLDLGCGWGRIAGPLLEAGMNVTGVDVDEQFIRQASQSYGSQPRAQFFQGNICGDDWQQLWGQQSYDRIFITYNTIYALLGRANVQRCIQEAAQRLTNEGELWLDIYPMDLFHGDLLRGEIPAEDDDEPVASWQESGLSISVHEKTEIDHHRQRLDVVYEARSPSADCLSTLTMRHDYLLTQEMRAIVASAGLKPLGEFGGFDGRALDEDAEQIIMGAHR